MSTLLIGILLGVIISPLGFGLVRTGFARVAAARSLRRLPEPPAIDEGRVEEAVYSGLYDARDSGLVERVPRSATGWSSTSPAGPRR
jgi:hypothetical protein